MPIRRDPFLANVQERGEYATTQEADRVARVILALLGAHLVGTLRAELAARLPETYALILLNPCRPRNPSRPNDSSARPPPGSRAQPRRRPWGTQAPSCPQRPPARAMTSPARSSFSCHPATTSSSATPTPPDLSPVRRPDP